MKKLPAFWTKRDVREARRAKTFAGLSVIALRVVERQYKEACEVGSGHVAIVSGTISNGGTLPIRKIRRNLRIFKRKIKELRALGIQVWDQMPFEEHLFRIRKLEGKKHDPEDLLVGFYLPIFSSGRVTLVFFLPNWRSSHGARWEKKMAKRYSIPVFYAR